MGQAIDLLENYPKANRDLSARVKSKSEESRNLARKFDKEYFDGDRNNGYGGFYYNEKYWRDVIPDIISRYKLTSDSKVLDVGCAKGFFLYDLKNAIPGIFVKGVDISAYAITNALPEVRSELLIANAVNLPFADNFFDFVISINTVHNLSITDCGLALKEIERVSKDSSFITVDAYRNDEEKARMEAWNLTALTMMSCVEWEIFFDKVGYSGDYYWFIP
jgi:ubiquinone/menaquinone biosynthesis C-methylase UbiE